MFDVLMSPVRIGWVTSVVATLTLIGLGEAARVIAWARDDPATVERLAAWSLPGHRHRPEVAVAASFAGMKAWLRPAAVIPLVFAPIPMLRPPADLATAVVAAAVLWWTVFAAIAVVSSQVSLRSTR